MLKKIVFILILLVALLVPSVASAYPLPSEDTTASPVVIEGIVPVSIDSTITVVLTQEQIDALAIAIGENVSIETTLSIEDTMTVDVDSFGSIPAEAIRGALFLFTLVFGFIFVGFVFRRRK